MQCAFPSVMPQIVRVRYSRHPCMQLKQYAGESFLRDSAVIRHRETLLASSIDQ
jgi:hypothetical protein